MERTLKALKAIMIPLVIAGILLSTLHQSSLGSLFLILPQKLHPLWYSPMLPVLFFVSAVCVGLAMTIFESWHSSRAFGKELELPLVKRLAEVLAVCIGVYLSIRFLDLWHRRALSTLDQPGIERWLFMLEIFLMAVPMLLLFREKVRANPAALYGTVVMFLLGFVTHRLNVSVTGLESASGVHYIPKWTEIVVTLSLIALGFAIFRFAVKNLPIFVEETHKAQPLASPAATEWAPVFTGGPVGGTAPGD